VKEIRLFRVGDQIPSDAKYITAHFGDTDLTSFFAYEIPIKTESSKKTIDCTAILITDIILMLNDVTGKKFSTKTDKTRKLIRARLNDGHDFDAFERVVRKKSSEWLTDPHMNQYLRPETLFGTKFESYLNQTTAQEMTQSAFDELEEHMK